MTNIWIMTMLKTEFAAFVEEQIALAGEILADAKVSKRDYMSGGKLSVFLALHRVLQGKPTEQDLGMLRLSEI
ncbi:hypothetical protein ALQ14_04904, partial [Pseudomonas savastanoi pv. glycinea]